MELWQLVVVVLAGIGGAVLCWKVDVATHDWHGDKVSWATAVLVGLSCALVASAALDILPR